MLLVAPSAIAAPTCVNQYDQGMKCGTPGAMPVGWTPLPGHPPPPTSGPPDPSEVELVSLFAIIALLFALIALMPDFDGWREGDWDEQDGED